MTAIKLWRWEFIEPGPPVTQTLLVGEALRAAASAVHSQKFDRLLPQDVHCDTRGGNRHAHWLAGDDDGDGLIDHAWAFCANGFNHDMIEALAAMRFVRLRGSKYHVAPGWMSPFITGGPFGPARSWRSVTPYITPNWRLTKTGNERVNFTPQAQLLKNIEECNFNQLPAPIDVAWRPSRWINDDLLLASDFVMRRNRAGEGHAPRRDAVAAFATLTFADPVTGPLMFGYGSHFGLGQMQPVNDTHAASGW